MSKPPRMRSDPDRDRAAILALVQQLQPAINGHDRTHRVDLVRQLAALAAPMGEQWLQLAQIIAADGEISLAKEAMDLFVQSKDGAPDGQYQAAQYQTAGLLADLGLWGDAASLLSTLPADVPDVASHAYSSGTAALYCGKVEQAREKLEQVTALLPRSGSAWLSLATLIDFAGEPEQAERLFAAEGAMENAAPSQRGIYYYAMGKAHADCGTHRKAFEAFDRAARYMQTTSLYRSTSDQMIAQDAVAGYDAQTIAAIASQQSEPTDRTIFIAGLPRSGTTLVEQILTSHSAISDGAEINRLSLFIKEINGLSQPALAEYVKQNGAPHAAKLWNHWMAERFPAPGRVIDKTTNSSRMLGLAASLLPDAPLIWMKRDPLDCAWSCFRTCFMNAQPWSYNLEDIAFHFRLEDQLLAQWQQILGDRLLVIPYEGLVSDSAQWITQILHHCGLEQEPQVFTPHTNRRAVATSSVMQVRNPINRKAIGAAEPYREFLAPFIKAYSD